MRRPGKLTPVNGDVRNENSQIVTSSKRPLLKEKKKKKKLSIFEKRVYKIRKRKTRNYFSFFISERRQNVTMTFTSPPPRTQPDMWNPKGHVTFTSVNPLKERGAAFVLLLSGDFFFFIFFWAVCLRRAGRVACLTTLEVKACKLRHRRWSQAANRLKLGDEGRRKELRQEHPFRRRSVVIYSVAFAAKRCTTRTTTVGDTSDDVFLGGRCRPRFLGGMGLTVCAPQFSATRPRHSQ